MTMLSSKGVVKSDQTVNVYKFVPPDQSDAVPGKKRPSAVNSAVCPDELTSDWRSASLESTTYHESSRILEGARNDAKQLMLKSNQMAEEILQDARKEVEQIRENAAAEGYQSGYEKGFKEGADRAILDHGKAMQSRMEELGRDMEAALNAVAEAKEKCLRTYLEELKDCAVAVAEKVIHLSLKSSGEIIKRMIISETERLKKTAWVKIYMEKTDYEMILETDADVIGELSRLSDNIKFIVMDKEHSGNCIIEMPDEIIDISVDTQLENIKEILQNIGI